MTKLSFSNSINLKWKRKMQKGIKIKKKENNSKEKQDTNKQNPPNIEENRNEKSSKSLNIF